MQTRRGGHSEQSAGRIYKLGPKTWQSEEAGTTVELDLNEIMKFVLLEYIVRLYIQNVDTSVEQSALMFKAGSQALSPIQSNVQALKPPCPQQTASIHPSTPC